MNNTTTHRSTLRLAIIGALTLCFLLGCAANPEKRVPRAAANAMTGSPETVTAISGMTIEGTGMSVTSAPPEKLAVTSFKRVMNFRRGQMRDEETRVGGQDVAFEREVLGFDERIAFRMDSRGAATQLSEEDARALRAEMYHHPIGFLLAVFSRNAPASNTRKEGNMEAVDIAVDGTTYTMFIDGATHLPLKIVSKIRRANSDVMMETSFDKYTDVHGYKLPSRIIRKLDNRVTSEINVDLQSAGAATGNLSSPSDIKPIAALLYESEGN